MPKIRLFFLVVSLFFGISSFVFFDLHTQVIPCANIGSCSENPVAQIENRASGTFLGQVVDVPQIHLGQEETEPQVLGETSAPNPNPNSQTHEHKHIYVDLETQKLYAFEGEKLIMETLVSTGLWGWTPPGEYRIWVKMRATRMSGGEGSDYYNLPNVPYVMFFYNKDIPKSRGYSLHGVYWHNNFGHPMSHGCVNMRTVDAEKMYHWVSPTTVNPTTHESKDDPGTLITICEKILTREGERPLCVE